MANSNDSSNKGQGPGKPGTETGPKKPSAVIDLKPSEVGISDPKAEGKNPQAAATVAAAAKAAAGGQGETSKETPRGAGSTEGGAGGAGASKSAGPAVAPSRPAPASSGGGLRGAATHLTAGLAGGLLALIGADQLAPQLGLTNVDRSKASQELVARVGALEASAKKAPASDVADQLARASSRIAELERMSGSLKQLAQQQAELASEAKALGAKLAEAPSAAVAGSSAGADERITKLEATLNTLTEAAADDPQRGRIPQLAGLIAKISDLEASLATQVAALRKGVTLEVDSRLGQASEAAQAARTGTQRLDRELAGVKTEAAQITARLDGIKAQADRAEVSIRGLREDTNGIKGELGTVREDLNRELRQVARPKDVATALSPLTSKLSVLEQNVQGVVRSEDDRRANVERIVTALELGNLKRTVERGVGFATELAEVRRVAGPKIDLSVLERYKDRGVPTLAELEREYRTVAFQIIEADAQPANAHWTDRLIASAKSVVRVRKIDQGADDKGVEATVARMEAGLKAGRLADVIAQAGKLDEKARAPAKAWLEKVEARAGVDRAIAGIEQELKASLGAASQSGKKG